MPKHTSWHSPAHQKEKTQLHPLENIYQSLLPGSLHKSLDQSHPPGAETRIKRNYNIAVYGNETINTVKQNEKTENYVSDEGSS